MRWAYLSRGLSRLVGHNFPKTKFGPDWRSFRDAWYTKYDWLEYSVEKDVAYCFHCFFFSNLQAIVHNLDMMFSQSRGLKIGRKHGKISSLMWEDQLAFTTMQEVIVKISEIRSKVTSLLNCIACLDPRDSFSRFDHDMLVELASIYSFDFSSNDCYLLSDQLNIYIVVMKRSPEFLACDSLSALALKLVQTGHHFDLFIGLSPHYTCIDITCGNNIS